MCLFCKSCQGLTSKVRCGMLCTVGERGEGRGRREGGEMGERGGEKEMGESRGEREREMRDGRGEGGKREREGKEGEGEESVNLYRMVLCSEIPS